MFDVSYQLDMFQVSNYNFPKKIEKKNVKNLNKLEANYP